ncbi:bifunctional metallophosphatase/5'-nucleotidase [Paenibacillus sacheonensis]|uniref:Bifunctional metallophosphatase/5'-nucleotidase n=1 Tax=Paenibacillus sacheonensis TaxID=742054 RepID=A0A7X5BWQ2_9BACL|nr:bifunctional UDP-sugar hydrolase/5'-nucleotidase [Paenibacillus sacheonensis]MBM7565394.1 2',3'-cyclic-nucleotide 2'-phosphodiesterase (5'-nucleotidase family) [Paenibacillus sacheonensis]NBC69678.1 bifunctional metallophosphatase/5'-nucleotidase [Paenibacillus sacheonensis]
MRDTANDAPHVVLLHSNDIHSRLEQAARIANYIKDARGTYGDHHLLTLDIGDHMDRMRVETEASDGLVNIDLMNAAGYEAVTLGNNEGLTFTPEQLDAAYAERAGFKTVCANLFRSEDGKRPSWMLPAVTIEKAGIRFGIVGVTAAYEEFYALLGWNAVNPLEAVAEQTARLRPEVDVIVVMSHLGLQIDRRMAESIPGIDLILGGHTHHLLEAPEVIGSTYICATGKFGEYIGRVDIRFGAESKRPVIQAAVIPMAAYSEEEEASSVISGALEEGKERLGRVVAVLDEALPAVNEHESPFGNLLAAGLRRWTGAEIGMVNAGQLLGGLAGGEVTAGDLHALCPSPINPCRLKLSGRDIRHSLEESLLPEFIEKPIRGFGFRGFVLGTLAVDGIEIRYDRERPPYGRISSVKANGQELEDDRLYEVGTIDMFTFGAGYERIKNGTDVAYFLPEFIRDVLERELRSSEAIADSFRQRWSSGA